MTEEEKETIEHANIIIKEGLDSEDDIQVILEKLLNLIQKQQEELEKKDKILEKIKQYAIGMNDKELLLILKCNEIDELYNKCKNEGLINE